MDGNLIFEIVGYVGMGFVLLSFLMKKILWLRILNTVGAALCCGYGFYTRTYPTAALNLALIIINIVMLFLMLRSNKKAITSTEENVKQEEEE